MVDNQNWIKKNKGYKFCLLPNDTQVKYLSQACGCKRKMYNQYLDIMAKALESQGFENGKIALSKLKLPSPAQIKKEFPFMKEVDSLVFCNAEIAFKNAITRYNDNAYKKQYVKSALKKQKTTGRELTFKDLKGYPVQRDLGLTELPPDTLTMMCYGVLDRNKYIDEGLIAVIELQKSQAG